MYLPYNCGVSNIAYLKLIEDKQTNNDEVNGTHC